MSTIRRAAADRFWEKVEITDTCWVWRGATLHGYGRFYVPPDERNVRDKNQMVPAHRWAHEQLRGPIADGLHLDHLCRNPRCVNPDHLEAVTPRENTLRGIGPAARRSAQTHCKNGHLFDAANTRFYRGMRACRECDKEKSRRRRAANPEREREAKRRYKAKKNTYRDAQQRHELVAAGIDEESF